MNDALMTLVSQIPQPLVASFANRWLAVSALQPIWMKVLLLGYLAFFIRFYIRRFLSPAPVNMHIDWLLKVFYAFAASCFALFSLTLANRIKPTGFFPIDLYSQILTGHLFSLLLVVAFCFTLYRFLRPVHRYRLGPMHIWSFIFFLFLATDAVSPGLSLRLFSQIQADLFAFTK